MITSPTSVTEEQLRVQYRLAGLPALGISFEAAMRSESISISLQCGAQAAAHAQQHHRAHPHWSDKVFN